MARIFVSHSAVGDSLAERTRDRLFERLGDVHEVFVDAHVLDAGDVWRSVIYDSLATSQVGVIVVNQAALTSRWVHREVDILLWRRALGADVLLVPVLLGDMAEAALGWAGMSELLEWQHVRVRDESDIDLVVDRVAACTAGLIGAADDDDPMTEWVSRIAGCLRDVQAKQLRASAHALGMHPDDLARLAVPEDGRRLFAHQLLERALEQPVYEAMGRLKGWLSDEHQRNLVEEVLPSWVEVGAARRLLAASVTDGGNPPVLVLNGSVDQTARHYIARATCRAVTGFRYATVGAVVGEAAVDDLVTAYEHGVRSLLKVHPKWPLEGTPPRPGVSFLIIDPGTVPMPVVGEAIAMLRERFPWLVMIVLAGPEVPARQQLKAWRLEDAYVIAPPLRPGQERQAYQMVEDLKDLLPQSMRADVR